MQGQAIEVFELDANKDFLRPGQARLIKPGNFDAGDPDCAELACACGEVFVITQRQFAGLMPVVCKNDNCEADFFIKQRPDLLSDIHGVTLEIMYRRVS